MNWIAIKGCHINLDNILFFQWRDERLFLTSSKGILYAYEDPDKIFYRELCNACCMNMEEG